MSTPSSSSLRACYAVDEMILSRDRLDAVLLAGAAGDGIGGPFEGQPGDLRRELPAPPWSLSDDTRLTLATCRAIARVRRVDPAAVAEELVREYRRGVPGIGSSTLKALRDLAAGQHWALAGARGEFAAGNGPAMRAAPLAFFGVATEPAYARTVRDVATITHHNEEAAAGALAVVLAMQHLASRDSGSWSAHLLAHLPDTALSDSLASLAPLPEGAFETAARTVGTSGRTAQSVAFALYLGTSAVSIETAIHEAIRAGGDTDTIAAIAAQLRASAGEALPEAWLQHLPLDEVRQLTAGFGRVEDERRPWWRLW